MTDYLATHTRAHVYKEQVQAALDAEEGSVLRAARRLGLTRRAVYMACERFELDLRAWRK